MKQTTEQKRQAGLQKAQETHSKNPRGNRPWALYLQTREPGESYASWLWEYNGE